MDIRVKICAWQWLLLTLKATSIKLQRRFDQTTSAFIGFLKSQLSDGFLTVHSSARATPAKTERPLRVIARGICKHLGFQCVRFPCCCLFANTRPQEKVSRENYEPCPQLSHGRSLYYGQTGSRAAQLWSCCLQLEPPFYVLLILFPRLCQSVHNNNNKIIRVASGHAHDTICDVFPSPVCSGAHPTKRQLSTRN